MIDITGLSSNQAANSRAKVNEQPAPEGKAQQTTATESPQATSGVSLSDDAQAVQKSVEQLVEDGVSVNEQKVAELKAAIEDGSYNIDYEGTARNLLNLEKLLG